MHGLNLPTTTLTSRLKRAIHGFKRSWSLNRWYLLSGMRIFIPTSLEGPTAGGTISGFRPKSPRSDRRSVYVTPARLLSPTKEPVRVAAIAIGEFGRFGNNLRNMFNALVAARHFQIPELICQDIPELPHGTWDTKFGVRVAHNPMKVSAADSAPSAIWAGEFFYGRYLPCEPKSEDKDLVSSGLREIFGLSNALPLSEDHLVIHFRSGDAFGPRPHHGQGQPPSSFYRRILKHVSPERVTLVFEDDKNPTIRATMEFLAESSIVWEVQSSSLRSDLEFLVRAKTLVASQGTFLPATTFLSPWIEKLYCFESFDTRMLKDSVKVLAVTDTRGIYRSEVMSNNWENTAYQRDLMTSYAEENLSAPS